MRSSSYHWVVPTKRFDPCSVSSYFVHQTLYCQKHVRVCLFYSIAPSIVSVEILSIKQFQFLQSLTPFSTIFLCLGCSMIRLKCLLILNSVPGRVLLVEIAKMFSNHQKQKNGMIKKLNQN